MKEKGLPCLCLSARQAAGALSKYYDNAFSELGLSVTQIALLRTIARKQETNITHLAQSMRLDKSTLTRTLAPLIAQGYICSERGSNRRETLLTLTELGNEAATKAEPLWENAQAEVIALLGGEEEAQEFAQKLLKLAGIANKC